MHQLSSTKRAGRWRPEFKLGLGEWMTRYLNEIDFLNRVFTVCIFEMSQAEITTLKSLFLTVLQHSQWQLYYSNSAVDLFDIKLKLKRKSAIS